MEKLYKDGAVAERDYVAARQVAETAKKQWDAAQKEVESLKNRPRYQEVAAAKASYLAAADAVQSLESGATSEQLESAKAAVETAQKAIDRIQVDIAETSVVAPESGLLKSFNLKPGDFIAPGQPSGEIVDLDSLKVKVYVPENRLGFVKEGMELSIKVDSFPGETFKGKVKSIAGEGEFTPRNLQTVEERVTQVFAVTVTVANPDHKLRPGMAADVTVMLR